MANDFYQKWLGGSFSALNETNMTGRVATYLSDLLPKNVKGFLQMNATEEIQKYALSLGSNKTPGLLTDLLHSSSQRLGLLLNPMW